VTLSYLPPNVIICYCISVGRAVQVAKWLVPLHAAREDLGSILNSQLGETPLSYSTSAMSTRESSPHTRQNFRKKSFRCEVGMNLMWRASRAAPLWRPVRTRRPVPATSPTPYPATSLSDTGTLRHKVPFFLLSCSRICGSGSVWISRVLICAAGSSRKIHSLQSSKKVQLKHYRYPVCSLCNIFYFFLMRRPNC
jgi:hypothetical protein